MFQTVFQRFDDWTMVGPLVALFLFMAVFFFQLVRIARKPQHEVAREAALPLTKDAPARKGEEAPR